MEEERKKCIILSDHDQQFDKINEHLDLLLLQNDTGESSIAENLVQQQGNKEGTENIECCAEIVVLTDPDKIQQKGRPKNPKRLMSLVEQERIKMAKAEAKKKKKTQTPQVRFALELVNNCIV